MSKIHLAKGTVYKINPEKVKLVQLFKGTSFWTQTTQINSENTGQVKRFVVAPFGQSLDPLGTKYR